MPPPRLIAFSCFGTIGLLICVPFFSGIQAQQTVSEGVYTEDQAGRGQAIYAQMCMACHGETLAGGLGPPLVGDDYLRYWQQEPVWQLVSKIQNTMPQGDAGSLSSQQTTDVVAYMLQVGGFPAGGAELSADEVALREVTWPTTDIVQPEDGVGLSPSRSFSPSGNLAQVMRGIYFPSSNIIFNVQSHDPAVPLARPDSIDTAGGFNWTVWGSGIYSGWELVDYAAIALAESAPLMLTPGRRCENGRPVPVDDPEWIRFTEELVEAGRAAYRASQTRNQDVLTEITFQLADACLLCHEVYRDKELPTIDPRDPSNKASRCIK